ncbi:MAG: protein translocase subunit SecD [Planctomycetota bacterium]
MEKNLGWKILLIIIVALAATWILYPPEKTLRPGLDLAGGTSLIYEIDTQDLTSEEITGLSTRVIDVYRKRIDPTNVQNLVWRPHGNTRFEIQIPLATAEARQKRKVYDQARSNLEDENINPASIMRALKMDPNERSIYFDEFARGSERRRRILDELADTYDKRIAAQQLRDTLQSRLQNAAENIDFAELTPAGLKTLAAEWILLDPNQIEDKLQSLTAGDKNKLSLLTDYIDLYRKWAGVLDELTASETGLNVTYTKALDRLEEINLNMVQFDTILELPLKTKSRRLRLQEIIAAFPDRKGKIDAVVTAFDNYRSLRGRVDDPEDVKRMLKGAGVLEFRILPRTDDEKITADQISTYVQNLRKNGPRLASDDQYVWCELENKNEWNVPDVIVADFGQKYYVLTSSKVDEKMLQEAGQRKWSLKKAYPSTGQMGTRAVGFLLDEVGGNLFWNVTSKNTERPLCILLDGRAISAPNIRSSIRRQGVIEGNFTQLEIEDMVNKLNAGSLPARIIEPPISEKTIGPTIGAENRDRGIKAGIYGLIVIAAFMALYYIGSGLIADFALCLNILFILAMMAFSRATFTLPGIAGIILTIGMSVDANVLIFERIREEQQRGSSLRIAIQNGYSRAFATILDANVTTFITALILYMVASEEIKGFTITLMLGIASSMFTALFVTRVIFRFLLSKRIVRDHLLMLTIIKNPRFDWMRARPVFLAISLLIITGGLFIFFARDDEKNNKCDIEFTGGTNAQITLKPGSQMTKEQVEQKFSTTARELGNEELAAASVYTIGQDNLTYEINTTETNKTTVTISFRNSNDYTPDTIAQAIRNTQENYPGELVNLRVRRDAQSSARFIITTSQINKSLVKAICQEAFAQHDPVVSDPIVNEIVNDAIMTAFADDLRLLDDLEPSIVSVEKITNEMVDQNLELIDFLGGAKILCTVQKSVTLDQLQGRLEDLRFKPDMRHLQWFPYEILGANLKPIESAAAFKSFIFISTQPEAGFRELSTQEWTAFIDNEKNKITAAASLQTSLARVTRIDPSIGKEAKTAAIIAVVLSLLAIVAYIWIRFGAVRYGLAAIIALAHDVAITLGAVVACTYIAPTIFGKALLIGDFKINLEIIAALLTIIGYSLNDTIVVFDRIRENRGKLPTLTPRIITNSINQTLSRTILTSFTTFLVVLIMYIWGGAGLRGFTFAMLIGIVVGTYSSIAIAAPILLIGKKSEGK